jgi:hypothetical protein
MKIKDFSFWLGAIFLVLVCAWILLDRLRKKITRRCFIEVIEEDGKKVPVTRFRKELIDSSRVTRCKSFKVKRRYKTILPTGEKVSFFIRLENKRYFRWRIPTALKTICCDCPDCASFTCVDVKDRSSISVVHGYSIMAKEWIWHRFNVPYESEFHLDGKTSAAVADFGRRLLHSKYLTSDTSDSPPATLDTVIKAVEDELE